MPCVVFNIACKQEDCAWRVTLAFCLRPCWPPCSHAEAHLPGTAQLTARCPCSCLDLSAFHSQAPLQVSPAGEWQLDDSKRLCVYMLERAISQLPEGQETVLGIFDLRGFKNKNADLGFVRFLVGCWGECNLGL